MPYFLQYCHYVCVYIYTYPGFETTVHWYVGSGWDREIHAQKLAIFERTCLSIRVLRMNSSTPCEGREQIFEIFTGRHEISGRRCPLHDVESWKSNSYRLSPVLSPPPLLFPFFVAYWLYNSGTVPPHKGFILQSVLLDNWGFSPSFLIRPVSEANSAAPSRLLDFPSMSFARQSRPGWLRTRSNVS